MKYVLAAVVPLLFLLSFLFAAYKKVRVYDSFTAGVKGAIPLVVSVFPYIVSVAMLAKLFEISGLEAALTARLAPLFRFTGIPEEISSLVLIKPLSGSGSISVLTEILERYGADSYAARCACVAYSTSDTIFYIGAIYFAGIPRKKLTTATVIAVFSYLAAVIFSCFLCRIM